MKATKNIQILLSLFSVLSIVASAAFFRFNFTPTLEFNDPLFYIVSSETQPNTLHTFKRYGYRYEIINPSTKQTLKPSRTQPLIIVSDSVVLARPRFEKLFTKTIESFTKHQKSAKFDIDDEAWVIISTKKLQIPRDLTNLKHLPFFNCSFTTNWDHYNTANGGPFVSVKMDLAHHLVQQALVDRQFEPFKILSKDDLASKQQVYNPDHTAYVFVVMGPYEALDCDFNILGPEFLSSAVLSIKHVSKHTDRRLVLLVEQSCYKGFADLLKEFGLNHVEIVPFTKDNGVWVDQKVFGYKYNHDVTFIAKSYYLMKINEYLEPSRQIDRLIFIDLDLFIFTSYDHLFDLDVPQESLIGTHDPAFTFPFNSGMFVISPGHEDFVKWSLEEVPRTKFSYYAPRKRKLTGSEQETFLYWFRSRSMFYFLPAEYNESALFKSQMMVHGDVHEPNEHISIHFCGPKPDVELKSSVGRLIVEQYIPEYEELEGKVQQWFEGYLDDN
ncbi:hypothetical protein P9112_008071 [Eukaryota sp. TZLM1-RC]